MNELKKTSKLVKAILEQDGRARNSDSFLYLKVIEHIADVKGYNLYGISVPVFLVSMKEYGFPPFESVRRSRQKIQADFPELAACDKVLEMRMEQKAEYFDYATDRGAYS